MEEGSPDLLSTIGQLAREYEQKFNELERAVAKIEPDQVARSLMQLSEQTTGRFRSVQMALFSMASGLGEQERAQMLQALTVLSGCFDEMRILFGFLAERRSGESQTP